MNGVIQDMHTAPGLVSTIEVARGYLNALESNDPSRILAFFAAGAKVVSPTYGQMNASDFYARLCADTKSVNISLRDISQSARDANLVFAHFDYTWVLNDGTTKVLEILDVFQMEQGKILNLRIFADGKK